MTEMTPAPQDPAGPSAMDEGSTPGDGSGQLLDGGSTGTDDGPAGLPAALVGALLVLVADLCGQYAFGTRFPVGVVTGVLGAPYLLYLIVRTNRAGTSL